MPVQPLAGHGVPSVASANDPSAVDLGVKFTADASGSITGIRFYKGAGNTGTHIGSLWTASGTLLGQVTFTSESATGWQEVDFSSPVAGDGRHHLCGLVLRAERWLLLRLGLLRQRGVDSPAHVPQSSAVSGGNGVYNYGGSPASPTTPTTRATTGWTWSSLSPRCTRCTLE